MKNGYVAFLDVLGFASIVANDVNGTRIERYLDALTRALTPRPQHGKSEFLVFSDSIIVTRDDDTVEDLRELIRGCSFLFGELLAEGIALRGAISWGPYHETKSDNGRFIAGKAIVEAYHFEQKQDWVGIMLAPSVLDACTNLAKLVERPMVPRFGKFDDWVSWTDQFEKRARFGAYVQPCEEIPFHAAPGEPINYAGYAIVPTAGKAQLRSINSSLKKSIEHVSRLRMLAPDPLAQRKYQRAAAWLQPISHFWNETTAMATALGDPQLQQVVSAALG